MLALESLEDRINPSASLNILGSGLQILVAGNDTVNLSTVNGSLVIAEVSAGQTITDNTAKFAVTGGAGSQTAVESAPLFGDFAAITISGTGAGQSVNFLGGTFVTTTVNDGTIATVSFAQAASAFIGDLNLVTSTSLTQSAPISGTGKINVIVGGSNAALNVGADLTSNNGPVNLQATGDVNIGAGVAVVSTYGSLTLNADLTPPGTGDDGLGTLTIGDGASVYGTSIATRGADVNIAPTATVGSAAAGERVASTFVASTIYLSSPQGIAFDSSGNLYVANQGTSTISKITPGGAKSIFCSSPLLSGPNGLAFGNNGNLYVSNTNNNTICVITPSGQASVFVDKTGGLSSPAGVVFDGSGNLYVANSGANTISAITPTAAVSSFVDSTHGLKSPNGLAFDKSGNLFVANLLGNTITKVTPAGQVSTFVGSTGVTAPQGLAFDSSGNLFVSEQYPNTIKKITPTGTASTFTTPTTDPTYPDGLAFGSDGNLYFANSIDSMILQATPAGTVSTFAGNTDLAGTRGIAFDSSGVLYVANGGSSTISKITPAGAISTFVAYGPALKFPSSLVVDSSGNVYVLNSYHHTVSKVSPGGVVNPLVTDIYASGALALDNVGNLYFSSYTNDFAYAIVDKLTPAGVISTSVDRSAGILNISGLAFDQSGNMYISEPEDSGKKHPSAVVKVTPSGVLSTVVDSHTLGQDNNPVRWRLIAAGTFL